MIDIAPGVSIDENEIHQEFIHAAGPGGQNVNKVATAVQLRFDVARSPSLSEDVRARLIRLAGHRMTDDGILIITARQHRTQMQNRQESLNQLIDLLRQAAIKPKPHFKTKPTFGSKQRRLESKRRRGEIKRLRNGVRGDHDS